MTACKWVIHFVLNSGSANDSTRFSRTNQRNVFDLCFGIWKHEAIFPHAAFFLSHIFFFFNLSSFSQTPLPEWEWKVRANQGVIAHHTSQCYNECCPWFRVPDPKKTQSSMQSTGADFNARLPFLLQVHGTAMNGVFKGTFEEADSAFLCSSLQESDDDIFSCDSAESLDSVSLPTPDHLPVSIWSRISCFPASTSFFGWFVLGGFRLLHRRNSASKFFYHTNAS